MGKVNDLKNSTGNVSEGNQKEFVSNARTAKLAMAELEKDLGKNSAKSGSVSVALSMLAQITALALDNKEAGKAIGKAADILAKK